MAKDQSGKGGQPGKMAHDQLTVGHLFQKSMTVAHLTNPLGVQGNSQQGTSASTGSQSQQSSNQSQQSSSKSK